MEPTIVCPWDFKGAHGVRIETAKNKLIAAQYKDLSTIALVPSRTITQGPSVRWISSMLSIMKPMNQKFLGPIFITGMEVGEAYNQGIKMILEEPKCQNYKYLLAYEDDVLPEPDAFVELLAVATETDADIVGSLYWYKGEGGFPMIYGDINEPLNHRPIHPDEERIKWCYGTGMGFTLFKIQQFRDYPMDGQWFQTVNEWNKEERTIKQKTQDLNYMDKVIERGGKICVAQKAKCGHYDASNDIIW